MTKKQMSLLTINAALSTILLGELAITGEFRISLFIPVIQMIIAIYLVIDVRKSKKGERK